MSPAQHIQKPATQDLYRQARSHAVVWTRDRTDRLLVTGADRREWLQGLLSNDVVALAAGHGCYACYLTPQGRMISDMRLLELGDRMLVDLPPGTATSLIERLDPFIIAEDVALADVTATVARASVHGPFAIEALESICLTEGRLARLGSNESLTADIGGRNAIVARARDLRLTGFDVYLDPAFVRTLLSALAGRGVLLGDAETFDLLRVEGGVPQFGVDMDHTTIPLEAGLEHEGISFTKGCYVGQEVIVRVMHRGHGRVARRLVGFRLESGRAVTDGSADLPGSVVWHESKEVGRVTSAARSNALGSELALGYVARDVAEPGTVVDIRPSKGAACSAVVSALPFLAHE